MSIKKLFSIYLLISSIVVLVDFVGIFYLLDALEKKEKMKSHVDEYGFYSMQLHELTSEFILYKEQRTKDQWLVIYNKLTLTVDQLFQYPSLQKYSNQIARPVSMIKHRFQDVIESENTESKNLKISLLTLSTSELNSYVRQVTSRVSKETQELVNIIFWVILGSLFALVLFIILGAVTALKLVFEPIFKLKQGIEQSMSNNTLYIPLQGADRNELIEISKSYANAQHKERESAKLAERQSIELKQLNNTLQEKIEQEVKARLSTVLLYKQIIDSSNDMVALVDHEYRLKLVNQAYLEFHHNNEAEVLNKTILEAHGVEVFARQKELFDQAFRGEKVDIQNELDMGDGEKLYINGSFAPFIPEPESKNIEGVLAISSDVTEEERAKNQQKQQEQLLIQQSKLASMGEMIGAIAHQWRQPLTAISGSLINIEETWEDGDLTREYLEKQINTSEQNLIFLSNTIDDFRNFFKPTKTKRPFDIIDSLCNAITLVSAQMKTYNIELALSIEKQSYTHLPNDQIKPTSIESFGYPNEFTQVLLNLLINAKDAIIENRDQEREIDILVDQTEKGILIKISDNGWGIPEEILPRVFEPYYTTKDQGKGTGIGLYMSKMIVEDNMEGSIEASNSETGAVFSILLPKFDKESLDT